MNKAEDMSFHGNLKTGLTRLESMRESAGQDFSHEHTPDWNVVEADDRYQWIYDGDKAVGLLDGRDGIFELRCHGPQSDCPDAVVPKHYHIVSYVGARISIRWWRRGDENARNAKNRKNWDLRLEKVEGGVRLVSIEDWNDGSRSSHEGLLRYDPTWGAYVMDLRTSIKARKLMTEQEFCNILPASISDSRPEKKRFPFTYWGNREGLRKMGNNPLWFNTVGAQDMYHEKNLPAGSFMGFGPDEVFNPVVEILETTGAVGFGTCDNLQDEHIMIAPHGESVAKSGWFEPTVSYRLFSIPKNLAEKIAEEAKHFDHGAFVAWKFQYPATPELPEDLNGVELPGSVHYGKSDWSKPIPWDKPFPGRLWTASPDPEAQIHYDRKVGRDKPGSIRLRAEGKELHFMPGSGHTLHTEEGQKYRYSMWIKTEGQVKAWIRTAEVLFSFYASENIIDSDNVGSDSDWTYVEAHVTGQGDDAPFAETALCVEGEGNAWFTDMTFEAVE